METRAHRRLKQLAVAFLREHGCGAVATEVRCPISRYRVDIAGYADTVGKGGRVVGDPAVAVGRSRRCAPRTILVECKQARADFLRDRRDLRRLLRQREELERLREALEEKRLRREEPELRRAGSSLFPELEEWDYAASRLPAYRDLLRRLRRVDAMLHGETKFHVTARYALADRLYVAAPRGLIRRGEVPPGWGLLECSRRALRDDDPNADLFGASVLEVVVKAPAHPVRDAYRQRLLRNIAVAASRAVAGSLGITG